jgi:hypothetical protein
MMDKEIIISRSRGEMMTVAWRLAAIGYSTAAKEKIVVLNRSTYKKTKTIQRLHADKDIVAVARSTKCGILTSG